MDNILWVVIVGAVMIAMAGFTLYVGTDIGGIIDEGNETASSQICNFEETEVEAGRLGCDQISDECVGEIEACNG